MAAYYLKSGATGAADGSSWTDAFTTLAAAWAVLGDGDTVYISPSHSEDAGASISLTTNHGTNSSPVKLLCVDESSPPTTLSTGAIISTGGGVNTDIIINSSGLMMHGIHWKWNRSGKWTGYSSASDNVKATSCTFELVGASAAGSHLVNESTTRCSFSWWEDCTWVFSHASQDIEVANGRNTFTGGVVAGTGTVPTTPFAVNGQTSKGHNTLIGVDLSGCSSNLLDVTDAAPITFRVIDCKLHASVTVVNGTPFDHAAVEVLLKNCDSGDTNYRYYRRTFVATELHETTKVRSGGASDGTTTVSRAVTTVATYPNIHFPYRTEWVSAWIPPALVGTSITAKMAFLHDSVTDLDDDEAWGEIEYPGTSGYPLGVFANDRVTDPIFGTPAAQADDSTASWTTTGMTNPNQQAVSVSFTPQESGWVRMRLCVAVASKTLYYDPKIQFV